MRKHASPTDFHARVASLREVALNLLEDVSQAGEPAFDGRDDVVVELQTVANTLGRVEARMPAPAPTPTPLTRAAPAVRPQALSGPRLTGDAAAVLALAESTIPSALSRTDEAERWLRVLRDHGVAGAALQAVGVPPAKLTTRAEPVSSRPVRGPDEDPVVIVAEEAADFASRRSAAATGTADVLFAVLAEYGQLFDRALYAAAAASREDLLAELVEGVRVTS